MLFKFYKMKYLTLISLLSILYLNNSFSQSVEFEEYKLDNGLHIILHQDNSAPVINTTLMFHVGGKNEDSNKNEAYDTFNGLSMTPSIHHLYDLGFIGFNSDSKLLISNWISKVTAKKLGLSLQMTVPIPDFEKRSKYIQFHEKNIFKS